jgi:hypothetical protein
VLTTRRYSLAVAIGVAAVGVAIAVGEESAGLTLAGLLVVAVIAAEAADARQTQQLDAERKRFDRQLEEEGHRLDRQLDAERKRNGAALEHARELADLADLRKLLDDAAIALHRADYTRADVGLGAATFGRRLAEWRPEALETLNARPRARRAPRPSRDPARRGRRGDRRVRRGH